MADPITAFATGIAALAPLAGVTVRTGRKALALIATPPQIVIYPSSGEVVPYGDPADNVSEYRATLECECWGADLAGLQAVINGLSQAAWLYRLQNDIEVLQSSLTFVTDDDGTTDGEKATMTFKLRVYVDKPVEFGTGTVTAEQFTNGNGVVVKTLP